MTAVEIEIEREKDRQRERETEREREKERCVVSCLSNWEAPFSSLKSLLPKCYSSETLILNLLAHTENPSKIYNFNLICYKYEKIV